MYGGRQEDEEQEQGEDLPCVAPLGKDLAALFVLSQQILAQPAAKLLSVGPKPPLDAGPVPCGLVRALQYPSVLRHLRLCTKELR